MAMLNADYGHSKPLEDPADRHSELSDVTQISVTGLFRGCLFACRHSARANFPRQMPRLFRLILAWLPFLVRILKVEKLQNKRFR